MIDSSNPEINVDELMEQVRREVARRKQNISLSPLEDLPLNSLNIDKKIVIINQIEALINDAEEMSRVPTKWPDKFNRFPLSYNAPLKRFILKVYGFLFKKQRTALFSLIQGMRQHLIWSSEVAEQTKTVHKAIEEMQKTIEETQARVVGVEKYFNQTQECIKLESDEENEILEKFYVAFEDEFRGSREIIIERLRNYFPILEKAELLKLNAPILDLGTGRGEWLSLLREWGYPAKGIDVNTILVERCRNQGLNVTEGEALEYLYSQPNESLAAVTGFHIIEHLPFPTLIRLVNETLRVLKPGGIAIFETPNPQNILVGSCNFYTDPTHLKPLPTILTKFLLEYLGFLEVTLLSLNAYGSTFHVNGAEVAERFNEYFYGPQDYAVVGYKLRK